MPQKNAVLHCVHIVDTLYTHCVDIVYTLCTSVNISSVESIYL